MHEVWATFGYCNRCRFGDSVHWLPCCSRVELCHFTSIPHRLWLLDLPACVQTVRHRGLLYMHRDRVLRSLLERLRYPCSVTRWYYETSVGGYSVYTDYHIFLAALYLAAEGSHDIVGYILASTCLPSYLLRQWTNVVISLELMRTMMLIVKTDHSSNYSDCPAHAEGGVEYLWKFSALLGGLA